MLVLVVICFHFSIFEPLETVWCIIPRKVFKLWFAFILVSLNHWKQFLEELPPLVEVVICFHFSIFEPLETVKGQKWGTFGSLWFAFILVSLNHWKQFHRGFYFYLCVVICFHFSIFEPLETVSPRKKRTLIQLWFAFILVSLNHWKQWKIQRLVPKRSCDLLSF